MMSPDDDNCQIYITSSHFHLNSTLCLSATSQTTTGHRLNNIPPTHCDLMPFSVLFFPLLNEIARNTSPPAKHPDTIPMVPPVRRLEASVQPELNSEAVTERTGLLLGGQLCGEAFAYHTQGPISLILSTKINNRTSTHFFTNIPQFDPSKNLYPSNRVL